MKPECRKRPGLPPLAVQLYVALRQLGVDHPMVADNMVGRAVRSQLTEAALNLQLEVLAGKIGCTIDDLQLDHDPMLRVRKYRPRKGAPIAAWYTPNAHDGAHLRWRSKRRQDAGSHATKTYVRGERGQLSDTALAKRERRREKDPKKWTALRGLAKPKRRASKSGAKIRNGKRKLRGGGFPPAGSRPFRRAP